MRTARLVALVAFAMGGAMACLLNPQPLPPDQPSPDGGPLASGAAADAASATDASVRLGDGEAGLAESAPDADVGDAGALAETDGEATDGAEAGDASDREASEAGRPSDANQE